MAATSFDSDFVVSAPPPLHPGISLRRLVDRRPLSTTLRPSPPVWLAGRPAVDTTPLRCAASRIVVVVGPPRRVNISREYFIVGVRPSDSRARRYLAAAACRCSSSSSPLSTRTTTSVLLSRLTRRRVTAARGPPEASGPTGIGYNLCGLESPLLAREKKPVARALWNFFYRTRSAVLVQHFVAGRRRVGCGELRIRPRRLVSADSRRSHRLISRINPMTRRRMDRQPVIGVGKQIRVVSEYFAPGRARDSIRFNGNCNTNNSMVAPSGNRNLLRTR